MATTDVNPTHSELIRQCRAILDVAPHIADVQAGLAEVAIEAGLQLRRRAASPSSTETLQACLEYWAELVTYCISPTVSAAKLHFCMAILSSALHDSKTAHACLEQGRRILPHMPAPQAVQAPAAAEALLQGLQLQNDSKTREIVGFAFLAVARLPFSWGECIADVTRFEPHRVVYERALQYLDHVVDREVVEAFFELSQICHYQARERQTVDTADKALQLQAKLIEKHPLHRTGIRFFSDTKLYAP